MSIDALLQAIMGSPDAEKKGGIAAQTGLSAGLAQSAIALIMGKLLAGHQAAPAGAERDATAATAGGFEAGAVGAEPASLAGLLERMRSQGAVDETALQATGLPQELSAKAGIDLPQAIKAIEAIMALLAGKKTAKPKAKAKTTTKPKSTTKAKSATKAKSTTKAKSATKAKSTTTKPKSTTKAKSTTKPKSTTTKAKSTTKPKSTTKTKTTAKPKAKAKTASKSGDWTVTG